MTEKKTSAQVSALEPNQIDGKGGARPPWLAYSLTLSKLPVSITHITIAEKSDQQTGKFRCQLEQELFQSVGAPY